MTSRQCDLAYRLGVCAVTLQSTRRTGESDPEQALSQDKNERVLGTALG